MLEGKTAKTTMAVVQGAGAPVFARGEGYFPLTVSEAFPSLQFNDPPEAQAARQIADPPGEDGDLRRGQFAQGWFVEVVEVRMSQQHQINWGQIADSQAGALDPFQQEEPVGEVRVDE